jgi:putative NADPH-quinone reductase
MKITAIDGHPGTDRLVSALLDRYLAAADAAGATVTRLNLRDLDYDPVLHVGYKGEQPLEPDLQRAQAAITDCDHLVVGFPLWWGSQPALLKGFFDRVFLPGFAFKYHNDDPFWDRLLAGRSADVFITGDTPKFYLRLVHRSPVLRSMKGQILGFAGFKPIKQFYFAPVRKSAAKTRDRWLAKAEARGRTIGSR